MWLIFSILSALTAAFVAITGKIGLKGMDPTLATGLRSFIMLLFMTSVIVISGKFKGISVLDQKAFWTIVISGVFGALSWLCYFIALRQAEASRVAAIDRLSIVFVILLAALFLSEKITWKVGIGAILTTIGTILIVIR